MSRIGVIGKIEKCDYPASSENPYTHRSHYVSYQSRIGRVLSCNSPFGWGGMSFSSPF